MLLGVPVAASRALLAAVPCPSVSGSTLPFFGVANATAEGEGGESPAMVCPNLLRSPVPTLSLVPDAGLSAVLGVAGIVDMRVSSRLPESSAAESGLERLLASAAAVPFM